MGPDTSNNEKPLSIGFTFFNEAGEQVDTLLDLHGFVRQHPDILKFCPDIHARIDQAYDFIEANQEDSKQVQKIAQEIRDLIYKYLALKPSTHPLKRNIPEIEEVPSSPTPSSTYIHYSTPPQHNGYQEFSTPNNNEFVPQTPPKSNDKTAVYQNFQTPETTNNYVYVEISTPTSTNPSTSTPPVFQAIPTPPAFQAVSTPPQAYPKTPNGKANPVLLSTLSTPSRLKVKVTAQSPLRQMLSASRLQVSISASDLLHQQTSLQETQTIEKASEVTLRDTFIYLESPKSTETEILTANSGVKISLPLHELDQPPSTLNTHHDIDAEELEYDSFKDSDKPTSPISPTTPTNMENKNKNDSNDDSSTSSTFIFKPRRLEIDFDKLHSSPTRTVMTSTPPPIYTTASQQNGQGTHTSHSGTQIRVEKRKNSGESKTSPTAITKQAEQANTANLLSETNSSTPSLQTQNHTPASNTKKKKRTPMAKTKSQTPSRTSPSQNSNSPPTPTSTFSSKNGRSKVSPDKTKKNHSLNNNLPIQLSPEDKIQQLEATAKTMLSSLKTSANLVTPKAKEKIEKVLNGIIELIKIRNEKLQSSDGSQQNKIDSLSNVLTNAYDVFKVNNQNKFEIKNLAGSDSCTKKDWENHFKPLHTTILQEKPVLKPDSSTWPYALDIAVGILALPLEIGLLIFRNIKISKHHTKMKEEAIEPKHSVNWKNRFSFFGYRAHSGIVLSDLDKAIDACSKDEEVIKHFAAPAA